MVQANTQTFTILALDPSVRIGGALVLSRVEIPLGDVAAGPTGYRVRVIDFDATSNKLYTAREYAKEKSGKLVDPFAPPQSFKSVAHRKAYETALLSDPTFHAQHTYAVVMRTLARFEFALGRRVSWSFSGHQLHIAPHAFCEPNAFYSEADRGLLFGYFRGKGGGTVFTCLSHDIVAHEATHALLDGLRNRYTDPSGPQQAGFHEGFSDVVALLSLFSLRSVIAAALAGELPQHARRKSVRLISKSLVTEEALVNGVLFGLGKQFGSELSGVRANALRRSVKLAPSAKYVDDDRFDDPHDWGELLAAAMLRCMVKLWVARIEQLGTFERDQYNLDSVVDEGAKVADHLLTMAIRALDYCPVVDVEFCDYLSALLTADREVTPDDSRFDYRDTILDMFSRYGIRPSAVGTDQTGCWNSFDQTSEPLYSRTNFESMLRDKDEVARFIWENRGLLEVDSRGYCEVISVRPSVRFGPDGFVLRETICEYVEIAEMFAAEMKALLGVERPEGMLSSQPVTAYGGGTIVFDQYGRIKYHVKRRLNDGLRQLKRITYLWQTGLLERSRDARGRFAVQHLHRARTEKA